MENWFNLDFFEFQSNVIYYIIIGSTCVLSLGYYIYYMKYVYGLEYNLNTLLDLVKIVEEKLPFIIDLENKYNIPPKIEENIYFFRFIMFFKTLYPDLNLFVSLINLEQKRTFYYFIEDLYSINDFEVFKKKKFNREMLFYLLMIIKQNIIAID